MFNKMKDAVAVNRMVAKRVAVGVVAGGASVSAFAQTTGTTTTFNFQPIIDSINAVGPAIIGVGGAVLGIVTIAWGIKMLRTFLGR